MLHEAMTSSMDRSCPYRTVFYYLSEHRYLSIISAHILRSALLKTGSGGNSPTAFHKFRISENSSGNAFSGSSSSGGIGYDDGAVSETCVSRIALSSASVTSGVLEMERKRVHIFKITHAASKNRNLLDRRTSVPSEGPSGFSRKKRKYVIPCSCSRSPPG